MRKFNIAVVGLWFALFALSLRPINYKERGILDRAVVDFNYEVIKICDSCTDLEVPMAEYNGQEDYQVVRDLPLYDNRLTGVILHNTFRFVVFVLAAINIAFYAGSGTLSRLLKAPVQRFVALRRYTRKKKATVEP